MYVETEEENHPRSIRRLIIILTKAAVLSWTKQVKNVRSPTSLPDAEIRIGKEDEKAEMRPRIPSSVVPELHFVLYLLIRIEVFVLPFIICFKPGKRVLLMLLNYISKTIVIIDIHHVGSISSRQGRVSMYYNQIFVIIV
jgi:hypothetical protein